jgi:hypothetical protein
MQELLELQIGALAFWSAATLRRFRRRSRRVNDDAMLGGPTVPTDVNENRQECESLA